MSSRNYKFIEGFPLGKYRRDVLPVQERPELNEEGLLALLSWRDVSLHGKPFLDDINGHYNFRPTPNGARSYATNVNKPKLPKYRKDMDLEERRQFLAERNEKIEARKRQPAHVARSTEHAVALFWSLSVGRSMVLGGLMSHIIEITETGRPFEVTEELGTLAAFSADAIVDMGLCLEEPIDTVYVEGQRVKPAVDPNLKARYDTFAPDIGKQLVDYGSYLVDKPEGFASADGIILLQATYTEQDRRIAKWEPQHTALLTAFPDIPISEDVLMQRVPLREIQTSIEGLRK